MVEEKNIIREKEKIAFCGLFCGDCFIHEQEIANQAKNLLKMLNEVDIKRVGKGLATLSNEWKALSHYKELSEALSALDELRCPRICRDGGGSESCKIRECCRIKKIKGCWKCNEFESCGTLSLLKPVNGSANMKNLKKIRSQGVQKFLEGKKYW